MAELNLDTLDVDAVNAEYNERIRLSRHDEQTRERAINIAVGDFLQLYLGGRRNNGVRISDPRFPKNATITVETTDTLGREDLIRIMAASIINGGVRYAFDALSAESTEDNGFTAKDWLEITFKPVTDGSDTSA